MTDQERIAQIKARERAATPGPWGYEKSEGDCGLTGKCPRDLIFCDEKCPGCEHWEIYKGAWPTGIDTVESGENTFFTDSDASFIAHAREDIPWLLAEVERLTAALEAAERRAEAAINTIFQYSGCCECACFDGNEYPGWCTKHDRETSCSDECDVPEWRGPCAENGGKANDA